MKSNITDLPSDADSMRRLLPEMLERIRGRLEFLKQLDAPMTPQEDLPISEFVSVGMAATVQLRRCKRSFICDWCLSLYQSLRACLVVFSMRT